MDWIGIMNKHRKTLSLEQLLQAYLMDMTEGLNFRMLCETENACMAAQVLWIESITITECSLVRE